MKNYTKMIFPVLRLDLGNQNINNNELLNSHLPNKC